MALIDAASATLAEIRPASIRAVCYRLFTMGLIGSMTKAETNRVSVQLTYAREEGFIPWDWIVDETREAERVNAWEDTAAYVETVKRAYRRDRGLTNRTGSKSGQKKGQYAERSHRCSTSSESLSA